MMKLRAAGLILFVILTVLLPGGCWDAHEINSLSIVAGIGIDTAEKEDEFDVTVQIRKVSNPTKEAPDQPFLLMDGTGSNVLEALEEISLRNNRDLFLHQNQTLIISREQAERGIRPLLDMFLRFHETRLEVWVIVADCPARDLLQVQLVQEPVTSSALSLMMEARSRISPHLAVNMLGVTAALLDASKGLVLPVVGIEDEFGTSKVVIQGSAVFVSDKMVGRLDEKETLGYALAAGSIKSGLLDVSDESGSAVLYISDSETSMKTRLVNGVVHADISIDATLSVAEITGFDGEKMPVVFDKLKTLAVDRMIELVTAAFQKSCVLDSDYLGIGSALGRSDPKAWESIKDNWEHLYPSTVLSLSVSGNLLETGKISDSLTMQGEQ